MRYKAILFDMDGVLIESEFLMRHSAIQALADYGITAKHEDFLEFTGMGEDRFVGGVAEKYGHKYEFAMKELAYDYYGQQVKEKTEVPEGIKEMLIKLHEKGILLAVCSGSTALIASAIGWASITIPAPPPKGVSSHFLCLSRV